MRPTCAPTCVCVVFSLVAQEGDQAVYDRIWELERAAELHEEKIRLLMSLARFQQQDLLRETLDRSLSDDVRLQDTIFVVSAVAANNQGKDLAWEFLKEQWDEFDRRYGGGGFGLMRLVAITNSFTTNEKRDDVAAFFEAHPTPAAERTIRQALERITLNVAWLDRNRGGAGAALRARYYATSDQLRSCTAHDDRNGRG